MKLDIYKRPETNEQFSYIAIPEGKMIPEGVLETNWEVVTRGREIDNPGGLRDFFIDKPLDQIEVKGYAIAGSKDFVEGQFSFKL
jgi:hypothetical protein